MASSSRPLTVVITGAGSGIGRATALAFAQRGARLALGDIDLAAASTTGCLAAARGAEAIALECDVRESTAVERLVAAALERDKRLDVVVNNAGLGHYGLVEDTDEATFRNLIETNLLGVHHGIRTAVPVMRRQRSGHIVVVGSVNGTIAWPYHGAYAATKAALKALTQALRMELAGSGVSATLVMPVNVRTGFYERARVSSMGYRPRPLGRTTTPESVARLIVRSVERRSPEMNQVRAFRVASVLAEAWPELADLAGRRFYRRERAKGR